MVEQWKAIKDYEGLYEVSDLGRVRSLNYLRTGTCRVLKLRTEKQGRVIVDLYLDGKKKTYTVHSLVALAFIGERPEGYDVLHANGNSQDNRLENLSYDTVTENMKDCYRYGSRGPKGKLNIIDVLFIRSLYETGNYSYRKLAKMFGVNNTNIGFIVRKESFPWLNDDGTIDDSKTSVSAS